MRRSSTRPLTALTLFAALVTACAVEDASDPGGDRAVEGAHMVGINADGVEQALPSERKERPLKSHGFTPKQGTCPGCGPLPDPWQEMGPLPDPWSPPSPDPTPSDNGTGAGNNGGNGKP